MMRPFFGRHGHHCHGEAEHGGPRGFMRGFDRNFERGFNRGFGGGWKGRTRRGDVKFLVLEVLVDGPRHGYEIIGAIEERRGFRPSAGSIYPTLQMLEDGGFVTAAEVGGKRVYTISDAGRALLTDRAADADDGDDDGEPDARHRLKASAMKLAAAVIGTRGTDDATIDRVRAILDKARKEIYAILASDEA
jgi:DNA-binding PadR family transcriptional regulator